MIVYTRVITDEEVQILEHDLIDITDWINKAVEGKINCCMKRAAKNFEEIAKKETHDTMPVKDIEKAKALFSRKDYSKRVQ